MRKRRSKHDEGILAPRISENERCGLRVEEHREDKSILEIGKQRHDFRK